MNIPFLFLGIIFLGFGIYFYSGRALVHLSAWQAMDETERRHIRIIPLCQNVGMVIGASGLIFILGALWATFRQSAFIWCMILWLVAAGIDVYWIGKSGRYNISDK